jgi:G:T-mismatch repair DNA endonuclease (very short patch repair protein)
LEERLNDPLFRERWYNAKIIKVSKIELRIKDQLREMGFVHSSEHKTYVLRYLPDFINFETKEIIEIYGDYWHCNPKIVKYSKSNWIHPKLKMTPEEKWQVDFERNKLIEDQGYKMIILWEDDIKKSNYNVARLLK